MDGGEKLMKVIGKAIKQNKTVNFQHEICVVDRWKDGDWYDKVTVTING